MKRKYEIGFILNPESSEEDVKKIIDLVVDEIKKHDGIIENIDEWGRRKLAYPIEKHKEGIYVFINTEALGTVFFAVERRLKLTEKVMRHVILRLDERFKKSNRLVKKWDKAEKLRKSQESNREDNTVKRFTERTDRTDRTERPDRTERTERKEERNGDS